MRSSNTQKAIWLVIIVVSLCWQPVPAQSRKRVIPFPEWSLDYENEAQLELVEVRIAGTPVAMGEAFDADENWLKEMTLRVKNISRKPIIALSVGAGLLAGTDEELPPHASFQYGITWHWGKSSDPEKGRSKGLVLKPGGIIELSYANVSNLNRKVLEKEGEATFCKLKFLAPALQYKDGTIITVAYMRFHGKG